MQGTHFDAIVVGGGPVGGRVARDIARAGFSVAILERHRRIGEPVQCSGLVTPRTLALAEISPAIAHNVLTGAAVYAPGGGRFEIGGDRTHALVLDRRVFDDLLVRQAAEAGAELLLGSRVVGLELLRGTVRVSVERGRRSLGYTATLVIGADGPRSVTAEFLGLPPAAEMIRASGAEVRLPKQAGRSQVLIFTGARYSPGFFAWAISLGGDRFRIGWGGGANPVARLVADYPDVFGGMEVIDRTGGLIPVGPRARSSGDNGMVVGDAAGHAKATSGGGLYTGLRCAGHCARTAIAALVSGDVSVSALAAYDRAWRDDIGVELHRAWTLRTAYHRLSDRDLTWMLRLLLVPGVRRIVDCFGDIDFPSRLAAAVMPAAPQLLRFIPGDDRWVAGLRTDERRPALAAQPIVLPAYAADGET